MWKEVERCYPIRARKTRPQDQELWYIGVLTTHMSVMILVGQQVPTACVDENKGRDRETFSKIWIYGDGCRGLGGITDRDHAWKREETALSGRRRPAGGGDICEELKDFIFSNFFFARDDGNRKGTEFYFGRAFAGRIRVQGPRERTGAQRPHLYSTHSSTLFLLAFWRNKKGASSCLATTTTPCTFAHCRRCRGQHQPLCNITL